MMSELVSSDHELEHRFDFVKQLFFSDELEEKTKKNPHFPTFLTTVRTSALMRNISSCSTEVASPHVAVSNKL